MAGLVLPGVANAKGGYGVVTPFYVGPLTIDGSTDSDVRTFAGNPDRVTFCASVCVGHGVWKTFSYRFPSHGLTEYTFYEFPDGTWYLEQFYTTLQRFRTQRGTKVGMTAGQAERREHLRNQSECVGVGLLVNARYNGQFYGTVVDLGFGRVLDLQAFGPYQLPC